MKITEVRKSLPKHSTKVYRRRPINAITDIAIHHSLTLTGSAEAYAEYHVKKLGWPGIGYHFVIEKDGEIKQCHDLEVISYHVGNSNGFSVGICITGDFRSQEPTDAQKLALRYLVNKYLPAKLPNLKNIKGHNEYPGYETKQCPAFNFREVLKKDNLMAKKDDQASNWAIEAQKWVIKNGISDGSRPRDPVTRQELWTMLHRREVK